MIEDNTLWLKKLNVKFMQTVDTGVYSELKTLARDRGVNVQELLRAVIIPDWMKSIDGNQSRRSRAHN